MICVFCNPEDYGIRFSGLFSPSEGHLQFGGIGNDTVFVPR